jgi:hypothetical protein
MTSITDPYEDVDFPSIAFKPEEPGEFIEITLENVRQVELERDGKKKTGIVLEGKDDDGVVRDWVAWNVFNKQQVREANAQLGGRVRITYDGLEAGAKNPAFAAKWFKVEVV